MHPGLAGSFKLEVRAHPLIVAAATLQARHTQSSYRVWVRCDGRAAVARDVCVSQGQRNRGLCDGRAAGRG